MTMQIFARVLMWGFIIAAALYFSRQYQQSSPTPEQEQAMLDAARHYSQFKLENASQGDHRPESTPNDAKLQQLQLNH